MKNNYNCGKCQYFKKSEVCKSIAELPCFKKTISNIKMNLRMIYNNDIQQYRQLIKKHETLAKKYKELNKKYNANIKRIQDIIGE